MRPIGLLFALLLGATPALADDPPPAAAPLHIAVQLVTLRGPGTETCPDDRAVRGALAAQFGYDPIAPEAPARLTLALTRGGAETRADLAFSDPSGSIRWADHVGTRGDCAQLLSAVALMVRVAIDPVVLPSAAAPVVPPPSTRPKVRVGLGAGAAFGVAPSPSAAISAQVGARWEFASLSAEAGFMLPASGKDEGLRTSLITGSIVPCAHYWIGALCGIFSLGARQVETLDATSRAGAVHAGAGIRLGVEIPFAQRFAVRVSGDGMVAIKPWVVRIKGVERWTVPSFSGALGAGLLANF